MRGVFLTYMAVWLVSMSAFYLTLTGCSQQPEDTVAAPAAVKPPPPRPVQFTPATSTHFIEPRGGDRISAAAKAGMASGGDLDRLAAPPDRPRAGRAVADGLAPHPPPSGRRASGNDHVRENLSSPTGKGAFR